MNYLGNCGRIEQFWDSQPILGDAGSHGRKEYAQKVSSETLLSCSFLDLHILSEISIFTSLKRVELLWFHVVSVPQNWAAPLLEEKETKFSDLTVPSNPDLEEIVLFLPDHWYKSYGYWENPRSLRSLGCLGTVTVVLHLVDLPHHMWHLPKVRSLSSNQILALTTSSINLSKNITVWKYLYDQWISGYFYCIHHGE